MEVGVLVTYGRGLREGKQGKGPQCRDEGLGLVRQECHTIRLDPELTPPLYDPASARMKTQLSNHTRQDHMLYNSTRDSK